MGSSLAFSLERWADLVETFADEDEAEDVIFAMLYRDHIHELLVSGATLSAEQAERLATADRRLLDLRETLLERVPAVFEDRASETYWWWHLDDESVLRAHAPLVAA